MANLVRSWSFQRVMQCGEERTQYEISYQPTVKGNHTLHIKVEGKHVRGSPFHVPVKALYRQFESPILSVTDPRLVGPRGITTTKRGELVAVLSERHCVIVFSPSGEKLRSFGSRGSGPGQFHHPRGVAVDAEGNILVTDTMNNRVEMFFPMVCSAKLLAVMEISPWSFFHQQILQ